MKAILFDLDGTLWRPTAEPDFATVHSAQADALTPFLTPPTWNSVSRLALVQDFWAAWTAQKVEDGKHPEYMETSGVSIAATFLAGRAVAELTSRQLWAAVNSVPLILGDPRPFDDASETLRSLHRMELRIAIVSNRAVERQFLEPRLRECGLLEHVDFLVTSADLGFRKPHALPFNTALDALAVDAADAAVVGDSIMNDVEPAERLGMAGILVSASDALGATPGRRVIRTLSELPSLLPSL